MLPLRLLAISLAFLLQPSLQHTLKQQGTIPNALSINKFSAWSPDAFFCALDELDQIEQIVRFSLATLPTTPPFMDARPVD